MKRFFTPAMAIAMLALFVALGGSAFAVRSAVRPVTVCGNGSIKGYAAVDIDQFVGPFPQQFSSDPKNFDARWQCNGRSPEVRFAGNNSFQIRFAGINVRSAVASGYTSRTRGSVNLVVRDGVVNVYGATAAGSNAAGDFGFTLIAY